MTKITIIKKDGIICAYKVKGHSGFAEEGKDIVCSAISAISQMILGGLKDVAHAEVESIVEDGFMQVFVKDYSNEKAQALLKTMELAFAELSKDYARYVKMEVKEDVY